MRLVLFSLFSVLSWAKQCDDSAYSCPDSSTCCKLADGDWGCCPMRNAVCCEDHIHCCPEGNVCNIEAGRCTQGKSFHTPLKKKSRAMLRNDYNEVICPDRQYKCPTGSTCCPLVQGAWGCCPAPEATCCADHMHCCPHAMRCDPSSQRCVDAEGWTAIPWLKKYLATPIKRKAPIDTHRPVAVDKYLPKELRRVPCGEGMSCPALTTCCHKENGKSTCCPLQKGVCCSDFCCPNGWQCVEGQDRCERAAQDHPFYV